MSEICCCGNCGPVDYHNNKCYEWTLISEMEGIQNMWAGQNIFKAFSGHNEEEPSKTSGLELRVIDFQTALVTHWIRSIPGFLM